jgi:hypothetical protein
MSFTVAVDTLKCIRTHSFLILRIQRIFLYTSNLPKAMNEERMKKRENGVRKVGEKKCLWHTLTC